VKLSEPTPLALDASGLRFAIVVARFNETVTRALLDGAVSALKERGAKEDQIEVAWVPGAFELPLVAQVQANRFDISAVICLGAVIRGETPHFEYVSHAAATGILRVSLESGKPVAFGVLTTDTPEQAYERAGGKVGNKGADAALTALEMVHLLTRLEDTATPL
jgi:6,7-dimethyl-8-ribityllumazine synthase